jgi:crotonobetainyl-CoA:carnitine CoA-transferase CaiB-like acyl-CoA transferase
MGAEVIKVENRAQGGDVGRTVGPAWLDDGDASARSVFFQGLNRGKKSITLDLSRPEGQQVLLKILTGCDAVMSNLRGDVPGKLGLTYDALKDNFPKIVCAHLTGYGREGERAHWPGYDFLMQAEAGYFDLTGEPGSAPARAGLSLVDLMTGSVLSMALLAAVMSARENGRGRDVDVSLFDLALYNLNYVGHWYLNNQIETTRLARSAHASLTPCQLYRTGDGWIYLMCNKEKFWRVLCQKIDRSPWIDDARFLTFKERLAHRELLTTLIDEALSTRSTADWMALFQGHVPAAPILDVKQALDNPWVRENDRLELQTLPGGRAFHYITPPIRYTDRVPPGLAPALGQHTDEVLTQAGLSAPEIAQLRAQGVI